MKLNEQQLKELFDTGETLLTDEQLNEFTSKNKNTSKDKFIELNPSDLKNNQQFTMINTLTKTIRLINH